MCCARPAWYPVWYHVRVGAWYPVRYHVYSVALFRLESLVVSRAQGVLALPFDARYPMRYHVRGASVSPGIFGYLRVSSGILETKWFFQSVTFAA